MINKIILIILILIYFFYNSKKIIENFSLDTNHIHTIGDSHSENGWNGVVKHHLGPLLCYSFGKEKLYRCDIRKFNIKDGDTIVFCLGEIDCRCHINKHITNTTTYQDIINNIVDDYFDAIELNVSISQKKLK